MSLFKRKKKSLLKHPWDKFYPNNDSFVDVPNKSIYELFYESADQHRNNIALNYFKNNISFDTLLICIDECAKALKANSVNAGDVVSICMANTPEAVIAFYAVNKIGAISNMIHPLSAEDEIKDSLNETNSKLLITIDITYSKIKNIISDTNIYKTIIVTPNNSMPFIIGLGYYVLKGRKTLPKTNQTTLFWNDFIISGKDEDDNNLIKTSKDQPAIILHSGGTTGNPKNIILSNGNANVVVRQVKIQFDKLDHTDSMLGILPLFHCFGLIVGIHVPLCVGASVSLIPQFDANKFDKLLINYKPTLLIGVPTLFEALINNKRVKKINLSFLKYVVVGGDSMSAAKQNQLNSFLKEHNCFSRLIQGYGMTETAGPVAFGGLGSDIPGAVGIPMPGVNMKIVDINTSETLPIYETGEIMISGPNVMLGYLNNESETNITLEKDNNGVIWTHTGDLGYFNEDGVLFFVQRLKRMLIVSGYNVYPSHIEEVIMSHPNVLNCGVVGVPHPYKVQVPKAFIVLKSGVDINHKIKKEIKELCEKKLARYMIPKYFEYRQSLPKTNLGKVNYRKLEKED